MTTRLVRFTLGALLCAGSLLAPHASAAEPDLRLESVRESLTGTHYRYRQYVDGLPVVGGELVITTDAEGLVLREERQLASVSARRVTTHAVRTATHIVNVGGVARRARRELREDEPLRPIAYYYDADTSELLRVEPLFFNAKAARVFEANPVSKLNAPALRDANDAASAVPAAAYSDVELPDANESGPLAGPNARIVDIENPAIPPIDAGGSLLLDREHDGFEDVNAYYHVDRMQRYLQSLGYRGAKRLVPYALPIDAHAAGGADNSYYVSSIEKGRGTLFFGDGGTDDAEDPDLVVHEYGHAVLDWIAPLAFAGAFSSEARALSEAFGDYLAFSDQYRWNVASGRDAACFADWDARCSGDDPSNRCAYAPESDCLRRIDGNRTMADYVRRDSSGVEHQNSTIWSSALRELFLALDSRHGPAEGKRISDTLVVESMFGLPADPTFAANAQRLVFVDALLFEGKHAPLICAAMTTRGILSDCHAGMPRGEWTLFQNPEQGLAIPDVNAAGAVASFRVFDDRIIEDVRVRVDIRHPSRGDLRITLVAPDGTEVVLQQLSIDRTADVHVTYGLTATPSQPLSILRGRVALGEWQLRIVDLRAGDAGTLESWSLILRFAGDERLTVRPPSNLRAIFPAAHVVGANGERWQTDLRLFSGARRTPVTLVFTPGNVDGRTEFSAITIMLEAEEVVALNDVVATVFGTAGFGQLEVMSGVTGVEAISRSYAVTARGTVGEAVTKGGTPADSSPPLACRSAEECTEPRPLAISLLRDDAAHRSNVTVTETNGGRGIVRVEFFDATTGLPAGTRREFAIEPHGLVQVPARGAAAMTAAVSVRSGTATIRAYASIVDSLSSDTSIATAEPAGRYAPAISAPGATGNWKTDVWVTDDVRDPVPASLLRFHEGGRTTAVAVRPLPPHALADFPDVVANTFHLPGAFGILSVPGANFVARVYTDAPGGGTVGQTIAPFSNGFTGAVSLLFADENETFRTNAGALNLSSEDLALVITLLDSAGRVIGTNTRTVPGGSIVQFPLSELAATPVTNGRVRFSIDGQGAFTPWLSRIDRRSGDPTYIPSP